MIHKELNARLSEDPEFTTLNGYVIALKGILAITVKARAVRFRTIRRRWEYETNHKGYRDKHLSRPRKRRSRSKRQVMMEEAE